jgi:antitoxin component YwqK of YwqJK toxin-antitoxin module
MWCARLLVVVIVGFAARASADPACEDEACEQSCAKGEPGACMRAALFHQDKTGSQTPTNAIASLRKARDFARTGCRAGDLGACAALLRIVTSAPPEHIYWPHDDRPNQLLDQWLWCEYKDREPGACAVLNAATDAVREQCDAGSAEACWHLYYYYGHGTVEKLEAAEKQTRGKLMMSDAKIAALMRKQACAIGRQDSTCEPPADPTTHPAAAVECEPGTTAVSSQGGTFCVDAKGTRQGMARQNYAWGDVQCTGRYRDGKKDGTWRCYWPDGSPQASGSFVAGQMDGAWELDYLGLGKAVTMTFKRGIPSGPFASWHGSGQHAAEGHFIDGVPDGQWTYWHPNGPMRARGRFARGVRTGAWTGWYRNGKTAVKMMFSGGVADGAYATWFENGKAREAGRYRAGKATGRWTQTCTGNERSGSYDADHAPTYGVSGDFCNLQLSF